MSIQLQISPFKKGLHSGTVTEINTRELELQPV